MRRICKIQSVIASPFRITDSITTPSGEVMPCITGKASHSEVQSQKGYRYRKGFWEQVVNDPEFQNRVECRDVLGMIEHPTDERDFLRTPYDKAAVVCVRAWVENDEPWIVLGLLNNEAGNNIKALVEVGHRPGCSTRAFGDYSQDEVSSFVSEEGFKLIGWDVVRSPNFEDIRMERVSDSMESLPAFRELMQMTQLRDSVAGDYNRSQLQKEIAAAVAALQRISSLI